MAFPPVLSGSAGSSSPGETCPTEKSSFGFSAAGTADSGRPLNPLCQAFDCTAAGP